MGSSKCGDNAPRFVQPSGKCMVNRYLMALSNMRDQNLKLDLVIFGRTVRFVPILLMLFGLFNELTTNALADQQKENVKEAHAIELADSKRLALLKSLSGQFKPGAHPAYSKLCDSVYAYADIHSANEVDLIGIGRDQFTAEDRQLVLNHFVETLHQVLDNDLPLATESDARTTDTELNSIWRMITANGEILPNAGSITVKGLRTTQRSWIKYRDAFATFARFEIGRAAATSIIARLTRERSDELRRLYQQ